MTMPAITRYSTSAYAIVFLPWLRLLPFLLGCMAFYAFYCILHTRRAACVRHLHLVTVSSVTVAGDEIFSVNGELLRGCSHAEAIALFKKTKTGPVVLQIGRRLRRGAV